jgi:Asp-tRNA(Asn)/Glu-tRNA(Gln) amidotransferase A subunit family amidase
MSAASMLHAQRVRPSPQLPSFDPMEKSIEELQRSMQAGEVTSRQLVEIYLARIAAFDKQGPTLNAISSVNPRARETADALDAERTSRGPRGPLHGIPILVKDSYETLEMPTTAGSIALATFHPKSDAFQIQRLKAAGAVILGKTNMDEFGEGITTVGTRFGRTRNPYDLDRNPGGSSGGTGVSVAANFATAGMAEDTCGSIRYPASSNNLVGLRGTQGLSSRAGMVPLSSTQDMGGPIARSVVDLAIMLDATVGPDANDPSTAGSAAHIPTSYRAGLRPEILKGARIGVVRSLFGGAPEDAEVTTVVQKRLDALKEAGAELSDVVVPGLTELLPGSSMIGADFKFDLAEYFAKHQDAPVKSLGEILDRGLFHAAFEGAMRRANAVEQRDNDAARRARIKRVAIRQAVESTLAENRLVALVYPALRRKPARIGDSQGGGSCQVSAASGLPALSLPAGFTDDAVPIGMELLGAPFSEQELLSLGYAAEQMQNLRQPPFTTPALVNGRAPAPKATTLTFGAAPSGRSERAVTALDLRYDGTTGRLNYLLRLSPPDVDRVRAVWIHQGTADKPGAGRHQLFGPSQPAEGSVVLSAPDRKDLAEGRLLVRFFVHERPGSAVDVPLAFDAEQRPGLTARGR